MSRAVASPTAEVVVGPAGADAVVAFSTREVGTCSHEVGDGDVTAARRTVMDAVRTEPERSVWMEQVHGAGVAVVSDEEAGRGLAARQDAIAGVDALVTTATDLALAVLVADCVPVLLAQSGAGIAVAHAGRTGVHEGVVGATVAALCDTTGEAPATATAVIGPAIGPCCYEVPAEMADAVAASVPVARSTTTWGTPSLDLPGAVEWQLAESGVTAVGRVGECTRCAAHRWFSHRASSADPGVRPGRLAGVAVRRGEAPRTGHVPWLGSST